MPIFSYLMFQAVHWAAKRGLRAEESFSNDTKKQEARRTGIRGETYAYWYLRRNRYVFVARNYTPRGIKGEVDLVGYDGKTLAFVEVRTRTVREGAPALPELSVTKEKQHVVVRTAQRFLAERHVGEALVALTFWQSTITRGNRQLSGCTRMLLARRFDESRPGHPHGGLRRGTI